MTHCKGLETHGQLHHGLVFHQVPVLLFCQEATPVAAQEPGKLEEWTEWQLSCHVWNAARVFRFWFYWPWGPSTGIHHCHSSRPSDGTDAALTDVANPRGYGSFIPYRSWTSTTTSATDTNSSAEHCLTGSLGTTEQKSWLVSRVG